MGDKSGAERENKMLGKGNLPWNRLSGKMTFELRPKEGNNSTKICWEGLSSSLRKPLVGKAGHVGASENQWGYITLSRGKWAMTGWEMSRTSDGEPY